MTQRIAIGNLGVSGYGLKVSKTGVDVLSAADGQLMFDSTAANTRIIMTGSISGTYSLARTRIDNVEVQLPSLDYEPIVFTGFINYVQTGSVGGVTDERAGHKFATHWMGNNTNTNPKDFTEFYWNPTTNRLKFNAQSINPSMGQAGLMDFRYIVFSNRSN